MIKTLKGISFLILAFFGLLIRPGLCADSQEDRLYTRRFAFLVGANNGGKDRVALRYAVEDARAIGRVLEDMGGVLPGDSHFLEEPDRESFFERTRELADLIDRARERFRRVEVIVYYSGHSDEKSLFLGDNRITYVEFMDFIKSLDADVRIAILDSCASGALTLPKGVIKRPPFLLDTAYDMKGYAIMTSSSASEAAQESGRLKRSFFTHNLISGMRGAADMNQDGRITLNEAYQFAFDGTLAQTEKTMAGPQHPNYRIEMSGTGDVIITELWKSTAVLVLASDVRGKIYIHNQKNILVAELDKSAGREMSLGLEAGDYRIINLDGRRALESVLTLARGKSQAIGRLDFSRAGRIPAGLRGKGNASLPAPTPRKVPNSWRIEIFGGVETKNPADLNMRASYEDMYYLFYGDDYFHYQLTQGEIASFNKTSFGGKARHLRHSVPFGIRVRYGLSKWLDLSLGMTHFAGNRESHFNYTYEIVENDGTTSLYSIDFLNYRLRAAGFCPSFGVHIKKDVLPLLGLETFLTTGPLFGRCLYAITYDSQWPQTAEQGDLENPETGFLEEKGSGVGWRIQVGTKIDLNLSRRTGLFFEGGYAAQAVPRISGPGTRSLISHRDTWEGEWGIKQDVKSEPWGTARFLWPSNGWTVFRGTWWYSRDFKLDLSGFQAKLGLFYRF